MNSLSPRYGVVTAIVDWALSGCPKNGSMCHVSFMSINEQKILSQHISDLPFPDDFKSVSKKLGFKTIGEVADKHVNDLLELEGFTYHMLQEYIQFMQENNLSHLIRQH